MEIRESARSIEVINDVDLVVVGASCTGVFAAVRAARLGLKVALIEVSGRCGGVAVNSLVNVWHSLFDEVGKKEIIKGLSVEVMERLKKRGAVIDRGHHEAWHFCFNSMELCCELDELISEHKNISLYLHTRVVTAQQDNKRVNAVIVEDKSGRRAITCKSVVDASGDADVLRRLGVETRLHPSLQPPTAAAVVSGVNHLNLREELTGDGPLKSGFIWCADVPGCSQAKAIFGTRVNKVDCAVADDLTSAEVEGRRQVRAMLDYLRNKHGYDKDIGLLNLPSVIGIRETVHALCHYTLTEEDVLHGIHFDDAIAFGSYRVDIHTQNGDGVLFKYLDGNQYFSGLSDNPAQYPERWRPETEVNPTYYSVPLRSIIAKDFDNVFVAGRCIDTNPGAHAAVRVMINCNQLGEAAGVAAAHLVQGNRASTELDASAIQLDLVAGGSCELLATTAKLPV